MATEDRAFRHRQIGGQPESLLLPVNWLTLNVVLDGQPGKGLAESKGQSAPASSPSGQDPPVPRMREIVSAQNHP
jgi:hypothetical protein